MNEWVQKLLSNEMGKKISSVADLMNVLCGRCGAEIDVALTRSGSAFRAKRVLKWTIHTFDSVDDGKTRAALLVGYLSWIRLVRPYHRHVLLTKIFSRVVETIITESATDLFVHAIAATTRQFAKSVCGLELLRWVPGLRTTFHVATGILPDSSISQRRVLLKEYIHAFDLALDYDFHDPDADTVTDTDADLELEMEAKMEMETDTKDEISPVSSLSSLSLQYSSSDEERPQLREFNTETTDKDLPKDPSTPALNTDPTPPMRLENAYGLTTVKFLIGEWFRRKPAATSS